MVTSSEQVGEVRLVARVALAVVARHLVLRALLEGAHHTTLLVQTVILLQETCIITTRGRIAKHILSLGNGCYGGKSCRLSLTSCLTLATNSRFAR